MFYDKFKQLCEEKNISPNKAGTDLGLSNSIVTKWKKTGATPHAKTLNKISEYFGVSINYLLDIEEKEEIKKDPALDVKTDTENKVSDLDSVALNIIHKLKPELQEDALAYLLELSARQRASEGKE